MKRLVYIVFIIVSFVLNSNAQVFNEQGLKFMKLFGWLESQYVDTVNLEKLSDNAIRELLHTLDPHSVYFTKDEVRRMNEPLQGNFEGVGISFTIYKDTVLVVSCSENGPSERIGILPGDRILAVDNESIAGVGITRQGVQQKLRGAKGTNVNIAVLRRNVKNLLLFTIFRDKIPINSIDASYKINPKTGYVRLSRFSATSQNELTKVFKDFRSSGIENLILDLTENTGGYLDIAISLADEFLTKDKLIVYTVGNQIEKKEYFATSKGQFEKGKLVIIINENSASASEIVAGAIQDWDRGIIVGRRSYGKGLVQRPFNFSDGSMVRLTVARYYTPTGRLIQKPYTDGYQAYNKELSNRAKNGELYGKEKNTGDTTKYFTLVKKRTVFGGGGITPDVFVPADSANQSPLLRNMLSKGMFNTFAIHYIDFKRELLKNKYPHFSKFKEEFKIDADILNEFTALCAEHQINVDSIELENSRDKISQIIKANIANELFNSSAFYEIMNTTDPDFIKAVEVIKNWEVHFNKP